MNLRILPILCALFAPVLNLPAAAVPSPEEHFGFVMGEDYRLANFTQTEAWFKKLASSSDRVRLVDIGPTEEGRRQPMLIVSSPANLAKLDHYKAISRELALAENPDPATASALAAEGRAIVWLSGGLHADETLGIHQIIETAWQLATRDDPETLRILDNVIILLAHANPDGQELVSDWYNRRPDPKTRVMDTPPRLYHKYAGHDNNRDFYMSNLKETANINRQLYTEWFPQIVYDSHQTSPRGAVVGTLPLRDPFSYVFDPLVITQSHTIGAAMHSRWIAGDMPGTTMRGNLAYAAWMNGGLSRSAYFNNMIGILTETGGLPTPTRLWLVPSRQLVTSNNPNPIAPQPWHFRRSIEYMLAGAYAILDYAARNRDTLLLNIHLMGRNSIARGSRDHWTRLPSHVAAMEKAARDAGVKTLSDPVPNIPHSYYGHLRRPELRDPRAFIITADPAAQHDRAAVAKFITALSLRGITIHKAAAPFTAGGKNYPENTYVIKAAQAFRPHVLDMFEPQEYPSDFLTDPASPNARPYDSAGYTPAIQMGIAFDRLLEALPDDLPLERLPRGVLVSPLPGAIVARLSLDDACRQPATPIDGHRQASAGIDIKNRNLKTENFAGYLVSHRPNHSFTLANRLLKAGADIYWLHNNDTAATNASSNNPKSAIHNPQSTIAPGTLYIPATPVSTPIVARAVAELGLDAIALSTPPAGIPALKLAPTRIALWDRYGGSVNSGWIRWLLEQYEYDFDLIHARQLDETPNLRDRYDVIIFASDAIPPPGQSREVRAPKPETIPGEFHHRLGSITAEKTIPALRRFLGQGGSIVTIGGSSSLARHLKLPLRDALVEKLPDGRERRLTREKFFIPGSILRAEFDPAVPLAWGMGKTAPVFFVHQTGPAISLQNPVFALAPDAAGRGLRPAAWLGADDFLLSGLAHGQRHAAGGLLAIEASVEKGKLYLLAPEVAFRGQSHATFKLLLNPLHLATAAGD